MPRACIDLASGDTDREYAQSFPGVGLEYALVCPECRKDPEAIGANLTTVSPERFAGIERDGGWLGEKEGIAGRPEVLVRPTGLRFEHREVALAGDRPAGIATLRPVPSSAQADCLVLADDGEVLRVGPGAGSVRRLMNALDSGLALEDLRRSLHDASFRPTDYHPGAGAFVTLIEDGRLRLSRLVEG